MMGCIKSKQQVANAEINWILTKSGPLPALSQYLELTSNDRAVIASDWKWLLDQNSSTDLLFRMGVEVLFQMFALDSSIQPTFPAFRGLTEQQVRISDAVPPTVNGFLVALAMVFDNINHIDAVVKPYLQQLGVIHRSKSTMRREHLDATEQALINVWTSVLQDRWKRISLSAGQYRARVVAWQRVFRLITTKMYEGFQGLD